MSDERNSDGVLHLKVKPGARVSPLRGLFTTRSGAVQMTHKSQRETSDEVTVEIQL